MKQSPTRCSSVCSGSNELNFRCASPKGFCSSSLSKTARKRSRSKLRSGHVSREHNAPAQTGSHWALSISFVFPDVAWLLFCEGLLCCGTICYGRSGMEETARPLLHTCSCSVLVIEIAGKQFTGLCG